MPPPPKCLTSWSPPTAPCGSSAPLPTGLAHHGNDQKAAILLWSPHTLCTQIIRGCRSSIRDNLPPVKTHLLHLPAAPDDPVHIVQVLSGSQDTCVLTSAGQLFTCETAPNRLQLVPPASLGQVRAACVTRGGGFALICSGGADDNSLSLQLLPADVSAAFAGSGARKYDISFAGNELQSTWHTTRFRCKDFAIAPHNAEHSERFLRLLRAQPSEQFAAADSFPMLAINNQLFAVICEPQEAAGAFNLVHTFAADIRDFWISAGADAIFVLLDSGHLQTLHCSALLGHRRLQSSQIALGDQLLAADLWPGDQLVYSNGWRVIQLRLRLNGASDQYEAAERREIPVCGGIAVARVPEASEALVLTENGFIYHWPLSDAAEDEEADDSYGWADASRLQKVDDHFVQRSERQLEQLLRLTTDYEELQAEIAELRVQRNVLQLAQRVQRLGDAPERPPLRARLQASKGIPPSVGPDTIYAGDRQHQLSVSRNSFFVTVKLQRQSPEEEWPLAAAEMWTICIRETHPLAAHTIVRSVRVMGAMFARSEPVQILLASESPEECLRLPEFAVQLLTFVRAGEDFQALAWEVPGDGLQMRELWSCWPRLGGTPFVYTDLWKQEKSPDKGAELEYRIRLPAEFSWHELLGILCDSPADMDFGPVGEESAYVCALGRWVRMSLGAADGEETQVLSLAALDAGALYEVKVCLLAELWRRCGGEGEAMAPRAELHREIVYTEEMAKECNQPGEDTEHLQQLLQRLKKVREAGADFSQQREAQT